MRCTQKADHYKSQILWCHIHRVRSTVTLFVAQKFFFLLSLISHLL